MGTTKSTRRAVSQDQYCLSKVAASTEEGEVADKTELPSRGMRQQEHHEIQGEVQSAAPGEEHPNATAHAGGHLAGKQLRKQQRVLVDTKLNLSHLFGKKANVVLVDKSRWRKSFPAAQQK